MVAAEQGRLRADRLASIKLVLVAGARPNFMKIASIVEAVDLHNRSNGRRVERLLVHTGQHYDQRMSQAFFDDLGLPQPDIDLGVGSASHAQQTAEIMKRFEPFLVKERPDVVLVVGDVNSTIACSLVAAKVVYDGAGRSSGRSKPLIGHVEAGLRSFDRSMPEEINRIETDAISDFLFITEKSAERNLLREGVSKRKIFFVGNTMVDTLLRHRERAQQSDVLARLGLAAGPASKTAHDYAILTLHRPANVDDEDTFRNILDAVSEMGRNLQILFPVHPRTLQRIRAFRLETFFDFDGTGSPGRAGDRRIRAIDPLGYLDFLALMSRAKLMLTDSGGIQEETTVLGIPCVTLRQNTERPVTITHGTNVLAGTNKMGIVRHAKRQLKRVLRSHAPQFWDGRAGERIVRVLTQRVK